jgi:hypothetical protein
MLIAGLHEIPMIPSTKHNSGSKPTHKGNHDVQGQQIFLVYIQTTVIRSVLIFVNNGVPRLLLVVCASPAPCDATSCGFLSLSFFVQCPNPSNP